MARDQNHGQGWHFSEVWEKCFWSLAGHIPQPWVQMILKKVQMNLKTYGPDNQSQLNAPPV